MSDLAGATILVVEDDDEIAFAVKMMLELKGCRLRVAKNGLEALESLKEMGMPNLILLDMKMPVMDGWQFAEEFHARYDHAAPIVVMTAAANPEKRAEQIQAESWIAKPFTLDSLYTKVDEFSS